MGKTIAYTNLTRFCYVVKQKANLDAWYKRFKLSYDDKRFNKAIIVYFKDTFFRKDSLEKIECDIKHLDINLLREHVSKVCEEYYTELIYTLYLFPKDIDKHFLYCSIMFLLNKASGYLKNIKRTNYHYCQSTHEKL